jgi:hypothetical protein
VSVTVTSGNAPVVVEPATVNGTGPNGTVTVNMPANGTVSVIGMLPAVWSVPFAATSAAVSVTGAARVTGADCVAVLACTTGLSRSALLVAKWSGSAGAATRLISPTTFTSSRSQRTEPRTPSVYDMPGNGTARTPTGRVLRM